MSRNPEEEPGPPPPGRAESVSRPEGGEARGQMQRAAGWLADHEPWFIAVVISLVVFQARLPAFLPVCAILAIPVFWICRKVARGRFTERTPLDLPVLILLVTVAISLYVSSDLDISLPIAYKILVEIALFYALVNYIRFYHQLRYLGPLILIGSAGIAVISLLGTKWSAEKIIPLAVYQVLPRLVIEPLNPDGYAPNLVGGTLAMLLPVAVAYLFCGRRTSHRLLGGIAFLLVGAALVLTKSRGAWIGVAIALLVLATWRSRWFLLAVPVVAVGALLVLRQVGTAAVADLILVSGTISSVDSRLEVWSRALYMMQDFPYTGIGIGTFPRVAQLLYPFFLVGPDTPVPHAHNIFLQAGIDFGLPGLVAIVGLWTALLLATASAARKLSKSELYPLAIGLLGAFVAYLGHGLTDAITAVSIKTGIILWILIGIATALRITLRASRRQPRPRA